MADEPENLTLRILQELRADMGELQSEVREMRADLSGQISELSTGLNGNTVILSSIAGMCFDHEERITKLEVR